MTWWREARFGMFIHWGIYAAPAGVWKGVPVKGVGEWIMYKGKIPRAEYVEIAKQFNPVRFDAAEWVGVAKRAGMKYMVITAKHHDGFAMFDSPSDPYNIVAATPYGKDPMKALAEACRRADMKLGFYYSQTQDWHHPGGAWHPDPPDPAAFRNYLDTKVKPQLRELLTQYGPIGLIWFDTPEHIAIEQSLELKRLVKSIQPDCIINGRVGNEIGDYGSLGDDEFPPGRIQGDWETPARLSGSWGYKSEDHNWKDVGELLDKLTDLAGKGVNYLLNVGPTAEGIIPPENVERLDAVGRWLAVNGEAIYATQAGPFAAAFPWGTMTQKPGRLYLLIRKWPGASLEIPGIATRARSASLLANPQARIGLAQNVDQTTGMRVLRLTLPTEPPDSRVSVVRLDVDGAVEQIK